MRSNSPDGPKTGQCGQEAAPANPSAWREKELERLTKDTYGPLFDALSPSEALQRSLANRLRQRMAAYGSPEYVLTWKQWDMLSGAPICALRAAGRRMSGSAFGGWPTLTLQDAHGRDRHNQKNGGVILSLLGMARRFPTLTKRDGRTLKGGRDRPNRSGGKSLCQTMLDDGHNTGYLNPKWCAWFMGYTQIHALLAPTAMPSSRKSPPSS